MNKIASRWQAQTEIQVPFFDLDPMNIVWHGHYVKYLEIARCVLFDSINYNYTQMHASGYAWPIVDMHLKYIASATFGQLLTVTADLIEWENRIKIAYVIRDAKTGQRLTKANTTQVAVNMETNELCFISPTILFEKLGLPQP
jgi:acyl-CoA thioester hydrolase